MGPMPITILNMQFQAYNQVLYLLSSTIDAFQLFPIKKSKKDCLIDSFVFHLYN